MMTRTSQVTTAYSSQATTWRYRFERLARGIGYTALLAALSIAILQTMQPALLQSVAERNVTPIDAARADSAELIARDIRRRIIAPAGVRDTATWPTLPITMRVIPSIRVRGVLSAASSAGMPVIWHNATGVQSLAIDASMVPGPVPSTIVAVSALTIPPDTTAISPNALTSDTGTAATPVSVVLRDAGGLLDSVSGPNAALRVQVKHLSGTATARILRDGHAVVEAHATLADSAAIRRVRIFSEVGWESKFVAAALEEAGWDVDGAVALTPNVLVRTGKTLSLDTTHYSAAVVLDSGVVPVRALRAFVAQGGGVILAGRALRDPSFASFAGVQVHGERPAIAGALLTESPLRGVGAYHLAPARDMIVLNSERNAPMIAVSRIGAGRVLANAYLSTWRWRMEGSDNSLSDHREWWSRLVSTVAFTPTSSPATRSADVLYNTQVPGDAAPVADLIARFGAPVGTFNVPDTGRSVRPPPIWLFVCIAGVALLAEWASRRLRGVR